MTTLPPDAPGGIMNHDHYSTLDEEVEAILKLHREKKQNHHHHHHNGESAFGGSFEEEEEQVAADDGINETVESLAKTLETIKNTKATAPEDESKHTMTESPTEEEAIGGTTKKRKSSLSISNKKLPLKSTHQQQQEEEGEGEQVEEEGETTTTATTPTPTKKQRKKKIPNKESTKWGIPTLKELQKPFFSGDTMECIKYLQQYGVLVPPPACCPRCNQSVTIRYSTRGGKKDTTLPLEWRCRRAACVYGDNNNDNNNNKGNGGKEWSRSFFEGSIFLKCRNKPLNELLQVFYYWCLLGISKHHTTGVVAQQQPASSQTSIIPNQIAVLLGWSPESVKEWSKKLRAWVSYYGLVDSSTDLSRHGKRVGGPNTIVEMGILEVPNVKASAASSTRRKRTKAGTFAGGGGGGTTNDDETDNNNNNCHKQYLLAGIERNSHGNFFVVRNIHVGLRRHDHNDDNSDSDDDDSDSDDDSSTVSSSTTTIEEAMERWIKPGTLIQTRPNDDQYYLNTHINTETYRHHILDPILTVNKLPVNSKQEMPKLYEDVWRKQNEGNIWYALLDLLRLLRLANVQLKEMEQEETHHHHDEQQEQQQAHQGGQQQQEE